MHRPVSDPTPSAARPDRWVGAARSGAVRALRAADNVVSSAYLSLFDERSSLSTFMFHGLFAGREEINAGLVDPQQRVTVDDFRFFLEYFLASGYRFVSIAQVLKGLPPGGRYALVTFDDGYFNNARALPLLREFNVPAAFFISTEHVRRGKCFWWDVLYREQRAAGAGDAEIGAELERLKRHTSEAIEEELTRRYGTAAFRPRGEVDRPFTPAELTEFAKEPLVTLGNHTANHAILTRYAPADAREQLLRCQLALEEMTGVMPVAVAYPNGNYSAQVLEICRELGLRLGIGVEPRKNRLDADPAGGEMLRLGRFTPAGGAALRAQCRVFRSDVRLYDTMRSFLK
jgi:peptidoglycan/xylan/chitin deacetylase (PgdA/CDA1 family)